MKLLKCIVRPNKVDEVKDALTKLSVSGMTVRRSGCQCRRFARIVRSQSMSQKFGRLETLEKDEWPAR